MTTTTAAPRGDETGDPRPPGDLTGAPSGPPIRRLRVLDTPGAPPIAPELLAALYTSVRDTPQYRWWLHTRHPERLAGAWRAGAGAAPLPNLAVSTTVRTPVEVAARVPALLALPAALLILDCRPAARLSLAPWLRAVGAAGARIGWVRVRGERCGARPALHPDWVRALRDECAAAGVPFAFGGWGAWWAPFEGAPTCRVCGCSEFDGCVPDFRGDSCAWVAADLCSRCVGRAMPAERAVKCRPTGGRVPAVLDGRRHHGVPAWGPWLAAPVGAPAPGAPVGHLRVNYYR